MATILKISEATTLAIHAMIYIAAYPELPVSTAKIAKRFNVSAAHLSKVMQRLTHIGLLRSQRGPSGGFLLTRPAEQITLLEIYEAIEGKLPTAVCLLETPACSGEICVISKLLQNIHKEVDKFLRKTTIDKQAKVFK
ncbi:MAG: Rrf2 family transcriptional regulator [Chlamydiae bacterium]|nr:MAG: Rrf2 family transcriptional regulator [Chlamydiota bacterium]